MPGKQRAWLVKSEPSAYSFQKLAKDGKTVWDGVRNFQARNNLRAMKAGDLLLYYHSNEGKEIVGLASVAREAFPDPKAPAGEDWSAVEVGYLAPLARSVTLATVKADALLKEMQLVRLSRISVVPVTPAEVARVLELAGTKAPKGVKLAEHAK